MTIDILGNMIEASILSPNPDFYGSLHNNGHLLTGYIHDPADRYLVSVFFFYYSRAAAAQSVTVNLLVVGSIPTRGDEIFTYLNLYFHFFALVSRQSAALNSATQHIMPPEFGRKWRTVCFIIRFPLPTLLCAGCSVKLDKNLLTITTYTVRHSQ